MNRLISIEQATHAYAISRRTINRRQGDGTLTRHYHPQTGVMLVDPAELDTIAGQRQHRPHRPATVADSLDDTSPTPNRDMRVLPTPDELDAAVARTLDASQLRLPRLFVRRR